MFAVKWDDKNRRQNVISLLAYIKRFLCLKFLETTKSSQWIFQYIDTKKCGGILRQPPSFPNFSSHTRNFLKQWRFLNESLRFYESKQNRPENVISPLTSIPIFRYRNFLETPKRSQCNFLVLWDEKKSTGKRDIPVASLSILAARSFSKQRGVPKENFRNSDTENLRQKNVISPSLIHAIFSLPDFCETPKCSQCTLSVKEDKNCLTEICITPVLFICFFPYQKVSQTTKISQWISPVLWFKVFPRKNQISPTLIHTNFSLGEFLWNPEEFPKTFSVIWEQNFDRKLRYPRFVHLFLQIPESFSNHEAFPIKISGTVIENFFHWKTWYPPSHPLKVFATGKILEPGSVPNKFFR